MDRIEIALKDACEDQRDALRKFHETGSEDDAARVHFESCLACERALDALATLREGCAVVRPPTGGYYATLSDMAPLLLLGAILLGGAGFIGYIAVDMFLHGDAEAKSEIRRLESKMRFVRMPGRPDTCVAATPGHRGLGPRFFGGVRCDNVEGRVESDEDIAWHLRDYDVTRIRGTDTCLAHAPDEDDDFVLPCGSDD